MKTIISTVFALLIGVLSLTGNAYAQDTIRIYGPGGPAPAMKEAASAFEKQTGVKVVVTAGPTPKWINNAKSDADLIFSGSEAMMADFVLAMDGRIAHQDVKPLYLRPLSILVRPGNPKKIKGVKDLLKPGVKILVVNGAGQTGVWEDMAGRKGDIKTVKLMRKNIAFYAKNSAEARQQWVESSKYDAWIIWNIWQVSNPKLADAIKIERSYAIYRDTGVVLTTKGKEVPAATQFANFLASPEGAKIFGKWGWMTK